MSGGGTSGSSLNQSSGCLNGILRRLLCTGSVPTHPSDQISESNATQLVKSPKDPNFEPNIHSSAGSVTPGIVARLMGLESLPETNWVSKRMAPDLVKRSRSVSFADYLMGFDLGDQDRDQQQHRRVKTSVSFREAPAVLSHQKSPDFVVVYLDNVDQAKEVGKKVEKSEVVKKEQRSKKMEKNRESDEVVKRKEKIVRIKQNRRIDRLKDEPRREFSVQSSPKSKGLKSARYRNGGANLKKESEHLPVKKATQKKKVVVEPRMKKKNQENSAAKEKEDRSPVSVLDIDDILIEHEAWLSGYSMPMNSNSKVKSLPEASYIDKQEVVPTKRREFEPIKDEESREYARLLAMKIHKWTAEDLNESNWAKNAVKYGGSEESCVEFEGMILDMLLDQAIGELVEISHDNLWTCYD